MLCLFSSSSPSPFTSLSTPLILSSPPLLNLPMICSDILGQKPCIQTLYPPALCWTVPQTDQTHCRDQMWQDWRLHQCHHQWHHWKASKLSKKITQADTLPSIKLDTGRLRGGGVAILSWFSAASSTSFNIFNILILNEYITAIKSFNFKFSIL